MKKVMLSLGMAAVVCCMMGCSAVQVVDAPRLTQQALTSRGTPVAHVSATNEGLFFLWFPLITGSSTSPGSIAFCEKTDLESTVNMVSSKAKSMGATQATDMVSIPNSMMLLVPIPFLFSWKSYKVSANAIK